MGGNAGDRNNITLWHGGEALIAATAAVCANTIVVQHVVGPVTVEGWIDHPNVTAVLHAGLPGQESGNALVDVLFADGDQATNPSGRLPYTIAKAREDYPADILYTSSDTTPQITYEEGLNIDYRCVLLVLPEAFVELSPAQVVRPQEHRAALRVWLRAQLHDLRVQRTQDLPL